VELFNGGQRWSPCSRASRPTSRTKACTRSP
jgi:hypothetical protein